MGGAAVARTPVAVLTAPSAEHTGAEPLPGTRAVQGVVSAAVGLACVGGAATAGATRQHAADSAQPHPPHRRRASRLTLVTLECTPVDIAMSVGGSGGVLFASGATPREPMTTSVDASSQRLGNLGTYPSTPGTRIVGGQMVMPSPLLETKLYIPKVRRGLVTRPRLSERLSRGSESKLTLVSAPAGFGKTTLLAEWLAASPGE